MIGELITLAAAGSATIVGFTQSRRIVRDKLRFVDGAHRAVVPFLAGIAAAVVAAPVVAILPLVGAGTAILFGAGVGTGVASGSREVRRTTVQ